MRTSRSLRKPLARKATKADHTDPKAGRQRGALPNFPALIAASRPDLHTRAPGQSPLKRVFTRPRPLAEESLRGGFMSADVQVSRTPAMKGLRRVRGTASEKRQGTKSRCTGHGRRGQVYGDLPAVSGLGGLNRAIGLIFFRTKHGYGPRCFGWRRFVRTPLHTLRRPSRTSS